MASGHLGLDADVSDSAVQDVPSGRRLALGAIVSLDALDSERQLLEHRVDELRRAQRLIVVRVRSPLTEDPDL